MKTMGGTASGTTFIDLEDVRVPVENLIGKVSVESFCPSSTYLHRISHDYM